MVDAISTDWRICRKRVTEGEFLIEESEEEEEEEDDDDDEEEEEVLELEDDERDGGRVKNGRGCERR